jgi:hypothetical protein
MNAQEFLTIAVLIFFMVSLVNVILSTLRSLVTAKSDSKFIVSLMNGLSYGFYAIVIQQMTSFSMVITVVITLVSNFIGVAMSMYILDMVKKDKVWKVSVTVLDNSENIAIINDLQANDLSASYFTMQSKNKKLLGIDIYSKSQKESLLLRELLEKYNVKYNISEVRNSL